MIFMISQPANERDSALLYPCILYSIQLPAHLMYIPLPIVIKKKSPFRGKVSFEPYWLLMMWVAMSFFKKGKSRGEIRSRRQKEEAVEFFNSHSYGKAQKQVNQIDWDGDRRRKESKGGDGRERMRNKHQGGSLMVNEIRDLPPCDVVMCRPCLYGWRISHRHRIFKREKKGSSSSHGFSCCISMCHRRGMLCDPRSTFLISHFP